MKTLRLFGISLLTVLMSVSFSACGGSDEEDDNGGGGNTPSVSKRLVKVTEEFSNNTFSDEYTYDSQGRIIKKESNSGTKTIYYYTYTDNLIVQKKKYANFSVEHLHTLENGLIVSGENDKYRKYQCTYENGRLTSMKEPMKERDYVYSYIWENGNIIRIDRNGEIYIKYEYTNYTAPQGFITPFGVEEDLGLFYGKSSKNLPSKCTSYDEEEGWEDTYDWTLKDGFPVNLIKRKSGSTYLAITTFEWE